MKAKQVVKLNDMPYRTEKLSLSEIENIFGGCGQVGAQCKKESDCCGSLKCKQKTGGSNAQYGNIDIPQFGYACS